MTASESAIAHGAGDRGRPPFDGARRVSVIIPTRNRRELLLRALQSLVAQRYRNWDALVVDDGSEDDTVDAVAAFGDPRVRVLSSPARRGAGHARWWGAGQVDGDFVAFLDSDDVWLPDKLWRQLALAEADGRQRLVVMCSPIADDGLRLVEIRQPPIRPGQRIADYVYTGRQATILSSCLLIDGDFARAVRFDPELRVNQDTDYLLSLERAGAAFISTSEALYVLDVRPRTDRISLNQQLIRHSLDWYARVSDDWSRAARRGFFLWDMSVRCAGNGSRRQGLWYYLRGFSLDAGPRRVMHQLLRVVGGGDVPAVLKRTHGLLNPERRLQSDLPPPIRDSSSI